LNGRWTEYFGERSAQAVFVGAHVVNRTDGSRTSDAGYQSGGARAGCAFSPPFGNHRLVVSAGGGMSAYRGTFTDRATGEVYEATAVPPSDPPETVPIPERLDYDRSGAFLNLRWKQGAAVTWSLDTSWDRTDYVEDYGEQTDLDPLDSRGLTVRPGVALRVGGIATLSMNAAFADLEYDDRPALDREGSSVPGTQRSYRYTRYGLALRVEPTGVWHLDLGVGLGNREDVYAGYYDSDIRSGYLAADRELGRKLRLRVLAGLRRVDYENATVTGNPVDDLRTSDERRFVGSLEHDLMDQLHWFAEGGVERTDSRDPVFAYDRRWVLTGIRFGQ
jgi:hypothetical protein